jgi:hypothetical protein
VIFHHFLQQSAEIYFRTATSPNLTFLLLEAILGTKNEIKRIRRGHYRGNNFQDSTKEKLLKQNIGYLPRVIFFNAFQLGTESKNQVFSSEEASRSILEIFSTRNCILSI